MCSNKNLQTAKKVKDDEFYTCEDDIARELANYNLKGLIVYCNCDDYRASKFYQYLSANFDALGIKGLYATGYNEDGKGYFAHYDGKSETTGFLNGNGDCFSQECVSILSKCDIVITNPPFSLFKDYVKLLMENKKKFIIIGTEAGVSYKDVFPYVMDGKIWIGCNMITKFRMPDGKIRKFGNICWFTNVVSEGKRMSLSAGNTSYSNEYKWYDNYDAIEVGSVKNIPSDFYGVMGVPVNYMKYLDPDEFEIVGLSSSSRENAGRYHLGGTTRAMIDGKKKFTRLFIKRKEKYKFVS